MNRLVKFTVIGVSSCLVLFLLLGTLLGRDANSEEAVYRHLTVYTEVLSRIKSEYVEEPNMHDVTLGALNGMLESIDPYASYLTADQYRQYKKEQESTKADVGLILSRKVGYVSVVDALPGSPAAKAGLTTGDMIETIDGVATRDMPLAYAEMLLQGKSGTDVELTILRVRQSAEPQEVTLVRARPEYPSVDSEVINGDIGLIRVRSLEQGKTKQVAKHVRQVVDQGAKRLILDLRRTAAGDPEEGIALADLFIDDGLITYLEGQQVQRRDFKASADSTLSDLPMVVAINRGTAKGGEIAAAALLENDRAEVVGERSYGDAALRRAVQLEDASAVILSVAKYHSPKGEALQDTGVTPSVVAMAREPEPSDDDEEPAIRAIPELSLDEDTILQKAIEVLTKGAAEVAQDGSSNRGEAGLGRLGIPRNRPR